MSLRAMSLGCMSYRDVEPTVRTGDVVLYNDARLGRASVDDRSACWLARLLALLPCTTYSLNDALTVDAVDDVESNCASLACVEPVDEPLHFRCAALIVCMLDETETNRERNENKLLPYVFTVKRYDNQCFQLIPLRELLGALTASERSMLALRQLSISSDGGMPELSKFGSYRRDSIRKQMLDFYQQVLHADSADSTHFGLPAMLLRFRAVVAQINRPVDLPVPAAGLVHTLGDHRLALFAGSPCYFVLYTMFKVNVLRQEPAVYSAIASVQENGLAEQLLAIGYTLSDEMPFSFP
jgi:hypothetical protein